MIVLPVANARNISMNRDLSVAAPPGMDQAMGRQLTSNSYRVSLPRSTATPGVRRLAAHHDWQCRCWPGPNSMRQKACRSTHRGRPGWLGGRTVDPACLPTCLAERTRSGQLLMAQHHRRVGRIQQGRQDVEAVLPTVLLFDQQGAGDEQKSPFTLGLGECSGLQVWCGRRASLRCTAVIAALPCASRAPARCSRRRSTPTPGAAASDDRSHFCDGVVGGVTRSAPGPNPRDGFSLRAGCST